MKHNSISQRPVAPPDNNLATTSVPASTRTVPPAASTPFATSRNDSNKRRLHAGINDYLSGRGDDKDPRPTQRQKREHGMDAFSTSGQSNADGSGSDIVAVHGQSGASRPIHDIQIAQHVLTQQEQEQQQASTEHCFNLITEEMGASLDQQGTHRAVQVLQKILDTSQLTLGDIHVTSSSGSVLTFIEKNGPLVFQHYIAETPFKRVMNCLRQNIDPAAAPENIVKVKEFWPEMQTMVLERVDPIVNAHLLQEAGQNHQARVYLESHAVQIHADILRGVLDLYEKGLSQGDVRLDNVGKATDAEKFVLFDLNCMRDANPKDLIRDFKTLKDSFKAWGIEVTAPADIEARYQDLLDPSSAATRLPVSAESEPYSSSGANAIALGTSRRPVAPAPTHGTENVLPTQTRAQNRGMPQETGVATGTNAIPLAPRRRHTVRTAVPLTGSNKLPLGKKRF